MVIKKLTHRKGQALHEFLFTYGWALIVFIAMLGGFIYFGFVDLAKSSVNDVCVLQSPLFCNDAGAGKSTAYILITNPLDVSIRVDRVAMGDCEKFFSQELRYGQNERFELVNCSKGADGQLVKEPVSVSYTDTRSGMPHIIGGEVVIRVNSSRV